MKNKTNNPNSPDNMKFIGSCSINVQKYFHPMLLSQSNNSIFQWITLSYDSSCDEFDGNLGKDDEEPTRILCNF